MAARALLIVGFLIACLPSSTAGAEPFAGQIERAALEARVTGADGRDWVIRVQLEELNPAGGRASLTTWISIDSCGATTCRGTAFALSPDVGAFTLSSDMSQAELAIEVAGRPLRVRWECPGGCGLSGGTTISVGGAVSNYDYHDMRFDGDLFGIACSGQGSVERETTVDPAGPSAPPASRPPKALPRGFVDGPARPRCREESGG